MNRYLLNLVVSVLLVFVSLSAFSQVSYTDNGDTKFYEDGTRISYLKISGFPNSDEMREYVTKKVLEHPDVNRVIIFKDGVMFMYEALQSVSPDMIFDMVNDALDGYIAEFGEFPKEENNNKQASSNFSISGNRGGNTPASVEGMKKKINSANRFAGVVKEGSNVNTK